MISESSYKNLDQIVKLSAFKSIELPKKGWVDTCHSALNLEAEIWSQHMPPVMSRLSQWVLVDE